MNTNLFIAKKIWKNHSKKSGLTSGSSWIASISVAISIMVMVLSIVISDGFKKEIRAKASGFSGEILLHNPGVEVTTSLYPVNANPSFLESINNLKEVKTLYPYVYRSAIIKKESAIHGVLLRGVDDSFDWSFFKEVLKEGTLPNLNALGESSENEVLISKRLANMLGIGCGERILFYFVGESVKARRFTVSGLYDAQLEELDQTLILTKASVLQEINGWGPNEVSGIEIKLRKSASIKESAKQIEEIIENAPMEESYFVTRVDELLPHLFDWLRLLDFNVLIIMVLMLIVAGFNMVSGLLIMLFEKISMIGLLKSLGMRDSSIHKVFLTRALYLVLIGMAVGNLIGLTLAVIQSYYKIIPLDPVNYFVEYIPIYINWYKLILLNIGSIAVITLVLLIPSFFIARVSPEKTLRVK